MGANARSGVRPGCVFVRAVSTVSCCLCRGEERHVCSSSGFDGQTCHFVLVRVLVGMVRVGMGGRKWTVKSIRALSLQFLSLQICRLFWQHSGC